MIQRPQLTSLQGTPDKDLKVGVDEPNFDEPEQQISQNNIKLPNVEED